MLPKKSKPAIRRKKSKPTRADTRLLALALLLAACRPAPESETPVSLRFRVAPLHDYAWLDRRSTGQPVDMKPAAEREALIRDLTQTPVADVLILRGLGSEASLHHLRDTLRGAGVDYQASYLPGPTPYRGLGFLHRNVEVAISSEQVPTTYSIGNREYIPTFGAVSVHTSDGRNLLVVNARFPDPAAPYERRRNEARLLMQALRQPVNNGEAVLLSLHSREDPDSPMMRMLTDIGLVRLQPEDTRGDHWTHRDPEGIVYLQDQWLFASPALAETLTTHGQVLDSPDLRTAGPYRHQLLSLP